MSKPDALTVKVGNLIHDSVCCELDSVDIVELGGDAHDARLNDVAAQIIELVSAEERKRIREVLEETYDQIRTENTDGMGDISRSDAAFLEGLSIAIDLTKKEQVTA